MYARCMQNAGPRGLEADKPSDGSEAGRQVGRARRRHRHRVRSEETSPTGHLCVGSNQRKRPPRQQPRRRHRVERETVAAVVDRWVPARATRPSPSETPDLDRVRRIAAWPDRCPPTVRPIALVGCDCFLGRAARLGRPATVLPPHAGSTPLGACIEGGPPCQQSDPTTIGAVDATCRVTGRAYARHG